MNISLHPGIGNLNPESLCYSLYAQLYLNFFEAQTKKDANNPYGIEEGDETSIRLRNTAYNFADAIAGAIGGDSSGGYPGGILTDYLKKSGDSMYGRLSANYGFQAGAENRTLISTFYAYTKDRDGVIIKERYGTFFYQDVEIGANNLYIGGRQILSYNQANLTSILKGDAIFFDAAVLSTYGVLAIQNPNGSKTKIEAEAIYINNNKVFHEGNANNDYSDWQMNHATVHGELTVHNKAVFSNKLIAKNGIELGYGNKAIITCSADTILLSGRLEILPEFGISVNDSYILRAVDQTDVQVNAVSGDLLIGSDSTNKIRLLSNLTDIKGSHVLISKYGAAYFPESLAVSHNYSDVLFSSYRKDSGDEGMVVHKKLRFGNSAGSYLNGRIEGIGFVSFVEHINAEANQRVTSAYETTFRYRTSASKFQDLSRYSDVFLISTEADFVVIDKPIESKGHIGIENSHTRLMDGVLFFDDERYLLRATDGIKHYGNAYFLNSLSSERFSSGFAGSGWAIMHNKTTGNIAATFDEVTIRKKMRIYELEVQKISATNGALWVSDNCSGDSVEKL